MLRTPHSKRAFHPDSGRKAHAALDEVGGGPEGTRTPDLLHAMQTRSQLRHRPKCRVCRAAAPGLALMRRPSHDSTWGRTGARGSEMRALIFRNTYVTMIVP